MTDPEATQQPIKLHRCGIHWLKIDGHPCWKVQKALEEAGVTYEVVTQPTFPRGRREEVKRQTGQHALPAIELADGTWIREDSAELAERVRSGKLG